MWGGLLCITAAPAGIHKLRQPSRQPAPPVWPSFASLRHLQAHVRVQMSGSPAAAVPTCVAVMLRLVAPLFIPPNEVVHAEAAHERRRHDCSSSAGTANLREVAAIRSHSCCRHHACFSTGSECEGYYKRVEPSLPKSSHCTSTITAAAQAEFLMQRHRQQGWWQALWFDAQAATAAAISAATKAGEVNDNRKWMQDASCLRHHHYPPVQQSFCKMWWQACVLALKAPYSRCHSPVGAFSSALHTAALRPPSRLHKAPTAS